MQVFKSGKFYLKADPITCAHWTADINKATVFLDSSDYLEAIRVRNKWEKDLLHIANNDNAMRKEILEDLKLLAECKKIKVGITELDEV